MKTKIFTPKLYCNDSGNNNGNNGGGGTGEGDGVLPPFIVPSGEVYTIPQNKEQINSGLFYLDGEVVIDGKWTFLGETVDLGGSGESGIGLGDGHHTHGDLDLLSLFNFTFTEGLYRQVLNHNLNRFPILLFLDENGVEVHPKVRHPTVNTTIVESNIELTGSIHILHSAMQANPLLFGELNLVSLDGTYTQLINHGTDSYPIFKFIDDTGVEVDFLVTHLSKNLAKIQSNVLIQGEIYML